MISSKKIHPFEDEGYDFHSSVCRRIVYRPIPSDSPLFDATKQPNKVLSLNLVAKHFEEGAVKWSELKPEPLQIVSIWFNALAFAHDKKRRLTTTLQEKKKMSEAQRKRKRTEMEAAEDEGINEQSEVMQVEKEEQFIGGKEYLTVHIETLFEEDAGGDPNVFKVGGFRLNVFDGSNDKSGLDLLTKGLQECLLESSRAKAKQNERLELLSKAVGNGSGKKGALKPTYELAPEFLFTAVHNDSRFLNLVSAYCVKDDFLSTTTTNQRTESKRKTGRGRREENDFFSGEEEEAAEEEASTIDEDTITPIYGLGDENDSADAYADSFTQFIDNRQFHSYNRTDNDGFVCRIGREGNTLHDLFDKEQAMFYHVEHARIRKEQRSLSSYCGDSEDEIESGWAESHASRKNPNRYTDIRHEIPDKNFNRYPFPSTTYRIDAQDLSQDKLFRLPLPHHIGAYLYTTKDSASVETRIKHATSEISPKPGRRNLFGKSTTKGGMVIESDSSELRFQPLGIHETEYEINTDLLNLFSPLVTEDMRRFMTSGNIGTVPESMQKAFLNIAKNDVEKALMSIEDGINATKKDYFIEKINGRVRNAPSQQLPSMKDFFQRTGNEKFSSLTAAHLCKNKDKQHSLDRRVFAEIGGDANAVLKEKQKYQSSANLAYYRAIIRKYRPVDATYDNAMAYGGGLQYDPTLMKRNIYQILAVLNKAGYAAIDREFYDRKTRQVREGKYAAYLATKRAFLEAITVEFYEEFRTSELVSRANYGIRQDLFGGLDGIQTNPKKRYVGRRMPQTKFNIQTRPYHYYKLWVYSYFTEHDSINNFYKTTNVLFHARYHHCRSYPPGCKDPKLNAILSGQGTAGKSHRLEAMKRASPTGVCEGLTHLSAQAFNVDQNMDGMLIINEEVSNKLISPATARGGTSESANDDVRNNFKERATSGVTASLIYYFDEETQTRRSKLSKCSCQNVILGATNNDLTDSDPNVMSRFIIISVPRSKNEVIGNRPLDKNKLDCGKDENKEIAIQEQIREVHRIYFMVECMITSGVMGNTHYGVHMNGGKIMIDKILDLLQSKYGIATNNTRKRTHVYEMARCMCISYAVWFGLTSPTTRHLQYDPYTGAYIGFNPRVLLDGIMPHLVITKDMVIDSITSLSCLWGHEYMDKILEYITKEMCNLHKLRPSDFLRRPRSELEGPNANTTATSAFTTTMGSNKKGGRGRGVDDGGGGGVGEDLIPDYNYITVSGKTLGDIYGLLSGSLGELCVAPNDISKILKELSENRIHTHSYEPRMSPDDPYVIEKLVKSQDESRFLNRSIVDYGKHPTTGLQSIAISVAFLKQKLPYVLEDSIIEDLTEFSHHSDLSSSSANIRNNEIEIDDDEENRGEGMFSDIQERLMNLMTIKSGSISETCLIKAIKDILQNDMLERNPKETTAEEEKNFEKYRDVFTGAVPWFTFPTSEHPPPLLVSSLFPHLRDKYTKTSGFSKDILLVDKISIIQLERKKNGLPLFHMNYNTIAPTAQSCFSVLSNQKEEEEEAAVDDNGEMEIHEIHDDEEDDEMEVEVSKNQYHVYSAHPVFKIDRDLDYLSCESHLRNIAFPYKRINGRLINYPPHVYMTLVDHRRSQKRPIELIPLCEDIFQRIDATRRIIEASVGIIAEDTPTYSELMNANYSQKDLEREEREMNEVTLNPVEAERQSFIYRRNEIAQSKKNRLSLNARYNVSLIDTIASSLSNVSRPTKRTKRS